VPLSLRTISPPALLLAALIALGCGNSDGDVDELAAGDTGERFTAEGVIAEIARTARIVLVEQDDGRMWSVSTAREHTVALSEPDGIVPDLLPGLPVRIYGARVGEDSIRPDSIIVLDLPPILLAQPRHGAMLVMPVIMIEGYTYRGRPAGYQLLHGEETLSEGTIRAEAFGARRYGAFRMRLPLERYDLTETLRLEVWPEGQGEEERISRRVRFADQRNLRLFYPNHEVDPARLRCDNVYPVSVSAAVLTPPEEIVRRLLTPPAGERGGGGFYSELEVFGGVRSASIQDRLARVDLERPAEGARLDSCGVVAALAQVQRTLSEAYDVERVEISVEGVELVAGRGVGRGR
jgi:hypothetical protein